MNKNITTEQQIVALAEQNKSLVAENAELRGMNLALQEEVQQLNTENDHLVSLRERDLSSIKQLAERHASLVEKMDLVAEGLRSEIRRLRKLLHDSSTKALAFGFQINLRTVSDVELAEARALAMDMDALENDLTDIKGFYDQSVRLRGAFYHYYVSTEDELSLVMGLEEDEATFPIQNPRNLRLELRHHPVFQEASLEVVRVANENDVETAQVDETFVEIRVDTKNGARKVFRGVTWIEAWRNAVQEGALLPWFNAPC